MFTPDGRKLPAGMHVSEQDEVVAELRAIERNDWSKDSRVFARALVLVLNNQAHILSTQGKIMSTIDDISTDEAALAAAAKQLVQLQANTLAALNDLKNNPSLPADFQTKIDALHTNLTSDLNDVLGALTPAGQPAPTIPSPAPVPDTGGATGDVATSTTT